MLLALLLLAAAAPPSRLAVLELRSKLATKDEVDIEYVTNAVRGYAKEAMPSLLVMTRENLLVLLQASGKKLEDCEGECEVETGRRVGADLVVSGEVLKFGTQFKVSMRLHDTRSGELISGAQAAGKSLDDLDRDLSGAVGKLLKPLAERLRQAEAVRAAEARQKPEARAQAPQQVTTPQAVSPQQQGTPPQTAPQPQPQPVEPVRAAAPAQDASFHPRLAFGLFAGGGLYEPSVKKPTGFTGGLPSGDTGYLYGLSGFAGVRAFPSWTFAAFADYDNFTRTDAGEVSGYALGGTARLHERGYVFYGGVGYSSIGTALGSGVLATLGLDLVSEPLAIRIQGGYRTFSHAQTSGAVTAEVSGSLLLLQAGLGLVF